MDTPESTAPGHEIATILRHDAKRNAYKIALLRAINDVVTGFPDLAVDGRDVAVPLRVLAARWVAYFWPFTDAAVPVWQGARTATASDMAFRRHLEALRAAWEATNGPAAPSDGFFLVDAMRVLRRRDRLAPPLAAAFETAVRKIADTIGKNPVRYAGPGEYAVFARPRRLDALGNVAALPGTSPGDACIVVRAELWAAFDALSLWVEALCVHEWSLFAESVNEGSMDRGAVFRLLTARPDNRVSLSWERNGVDVLMMEGHVFTCPWTERPLTVPGAYDLDHLVPLAVYPVGELWNLAPSDREFQQYIKRDRLPSAARIEMARPHLSTTYGHYLTSGDLGGLLRQSVALRFSGADPERPAEIADATLRFIVHVTTTRNVATF